MTNYLKKIVSSSTIVFITSGVAGLIAYITNIVLARQLTQEEFGLFSATFTFITFFLFFRDLGIGDALVKYFPEYQVNKQYNKIKTSASSVVFFQLLSSLIFTGVIFMLSGYLAEHYFKDPLAESVLKLLLLYVLGSVFFRLIKSIFNGFQQTMAYSLLALLKNGITLILILIFFSLGLTLYSPVLAEALVCVVIILIFLPTFLKSFPFWKWKIENFWPVTKEIFAFGLPVFATSVAGKIISQIDTLMLTYFTDLSKVAVYNVVLPSATLFLSFSGCISIIIFPMTSELWAKKDLKRIAEGLKLLYKYSFVILIPIFSIIIIFSDLFIRSFFGENYVSGSLAFQILMVGVFFYTVGGINNTIISAMGNPKVVFKIILIAAIINVCFNFLLIPYFGINGAALTTTLSYCIILLLSMKSIKNYVPIEFPIRAWTKLFFMGVFLIGLMFCLKHFLILNPWNEFGIVLVTSFLVYFFLINLLNIVNMEEIRKYYKLIKKKID